MEKTERELFVERMKARTFIRNYVKANGELPSTAAVKAARALTEDEIAEIQDAADVDSLIALSEDKEPSAIALSIPTPTVGFNRVTPSFGVIEFDNSDQIEQ